MQKADEKSSIRDRCRRYEQFVPGIMAIKAALRVTSSESEPKNIDLFLFLSHLKPLVLANHLLLQSETIDNENTPSWSSPQVIFDLM